MDNNVIITVRTSEEIKEELKKRAMKENRSLNNYILTILLKEIKKDSK